MRRNERIFVFKMRPNEMRPVVYT